jgi:hypothetical protein
MRPTPTKLAAALLLTTAAVSCATSSTHDSAPASSATSTVRSLPRGPHSEIADIWLPQGATLDPYSNNKLEMWHANASLGATTKAMNSLLPVNQPLDGLPWCGSIETASGSTWWAWGTSTDVVRVGVSEFPDTVMIEIGRFAPKSGVCTAAARAGR